MTLCMRHAFLVVFSVLFCGCAELFLANAKLDKSLPVVEDVQVLPDVSSIAFEWRRMNDANIEGFVVYRKSREGEFKPIEIIKNPLATHYYDKGLKSESVYGYQFATLGKDKTLSERSRVLRVRTSFIDPVEGLYASSDEPRLVKLIWSPHNNPSVSKYVIEKQIDGEWKKIGEVPNRLGVEYFDRDLRDGTTYEYRIYGVSYQGDHTRYSETRSATTKYPPKPLENLKASQDIPSLIRLRWEASDNPDVRGYIIYASQSENGKYKRVTQTHKTKYEFRTHKDGESWFFKVVALDKDGIQGVLQEAKIVFGNSLQPPATPVLIKSTIEDSKAVLEWELPQKERIAKVFVYRQEGVLNDPLRFELGGDAQKFVDKEMQEGVEYVYWVESVDVNEIASQPSQKVKLKF